MLYVLLVCLSGGLLAALCFIHFFVDWIFQSHTEAMAKHANAKIRAKHCAIYTAGFVPMLGFFLYLRELTIFEFLASLTILFVSHFCEDTYYPVFLWAKHIRKPSEMACEDQKEGFKRFIETPIGKILMITIDQIIHITFLLPIVYFVIHHLVK